MRRLLFSMGIGLLVSPGAWAQTPSSHDSMPQIPFGQTYKDFQFPLYQNGVLSATLSAVSAKGITINRAETTDLKIDLYTNGKVTTTITSPKADLYVADRKLRTKNTVQVERADLEATAQVCDFDLLSKKYLLRQNVRVVLKNFDAGGTAKAPAGAKPVAGSPAAAPVPPPPVDDDTQPIMPTPGAHIARPGESIMDVPGASADTNTAPIQPPVSPSP